MFSFLKPHSFVVGVVNMCRRGFWRR